MTKWNQFIELVAKKKKEKILEKIEVKGIITMIYSGAFDESAELSGGSFAKYAEMTQEILKATGSKASVPTAMKNDLIGLDRVIALKDPSLLAIWRWQVNPLAKTNLIPALMPVLNQNNFHEYKIPNNYFTMERSGNGLVTYLTTCWNELFEDPQAHNITVKEKNVRVALPGVITARAERTYGNEGKKMALISFYTGEDLASDLVMWPAFGENDFNRARYESMSPLVRGVMIVKPTEWNGKRGGRIEAFIRDIGQMRRQTEVTNANK